MVLNSCRKKELPPATCKICCTVTDTNNIPVDGVKIDIKGSQQTDAHYTLTQSNGIGCIGNLEPDSYHFIISKNGYSSVQKDIEVTDEEQQQNFIIHKIIALFGKDTIVNITGSSAIAKETITDLGYLGYVTQHGHCWSSTNNNPTIYDSKTTLDSLNHPAQFTSALTGLFPNTTYYVKAYATNSLGTVYSNMVSFSTFSLTVPTVTTTAVTNITNSTAVSGGNVTNDGSATVTARGVCWSINQSPTISDSHTTNGSGTGSFTSNITGLIAGLRYYVRAYATNISGPAYGNQLSFLAAFNCGSDLLTDVRDNKQYNTVQVSTQCWMGQNLNIGEMMVRNSSADDLQTNNNVIEKYCFGNTLSLCDTYGGLYEWNEMMQYHPSDGGQTGTTQGICPSGWHIPTQSEWIILTNNLGGWSAAGGAMKETGTSHWSSPNTGATNSSGYTALAGGLSTYGTGSGFLFFQKLVQANFWTATIDSGNNAFYMQLTNSTDDASYGFTMGSKYGLSVRCIKN